MARLAMIVALLASLLLSPPAVEEEIATGDAEYALRAEGASRGTAAPARIEAALVHYRAAVAASPRSTLAEARLLRALFFRATFCPAARAERLALLTEGRSLGEHAIRGLEAALASDRGEGLARLRAEAGAIDLYFWTAACWGEWALARGTFAAAREGAAGRIRDLATTVRDLDPSYEQGGGDRILGRLHDQSPRIPFFTGWVSRDAAVLHLERALALGPANSVNRFFLAEALLDHAPARGAEARRLLEACATAPPRPEYAVEDARYAALARARLEVLR